MNASEHILWSFSENYKVNHRVEDDDWVGQVIPKKSIQAQKVQNEDEKEILNEFKENTKIIINSYENKEVQKLKTEFQSYSPFRSITIFHILIFSVGMGILLHLLFRRRK